MPCDLANYLFSVLKSPPGVCSLQREGTKDLAIFNNSGLIIMIISHWYKVFAFRISKYFINIKPPGPHGRRYLDAEFEGLSASWLGRGFLPFR